MFGSYQRHLMEMSREKTQTTIDRRRGFNAGYEVGRVDRGYNRLKSADEIKAMATFEPCSKSFVEGYVNGYTLANPV